MATNANILRAELIRAGKTARDVATLLGVSINTAYNKLNGTSQLKSSEILALVRLLGIEQSRIGEIFFA